MKKRGRRVILPPELPPELAEEDVDVSDEDIAFVRENYEYAGFVSRLDTNSITKHVKRVAEVKQEELEMLYEKRSKKNKNNIDVDSKPTLLVDALPVKTLDGILYYQQTVPDEKSKNDDETEADDDKNSVIKLSKAEKRAKLKKLKKEAKFSGNLKPEDDKKFLNSQAAVLEEVKQDLSSEEAIEIKKTKLAEMGLGLLAEPAANIKTLKDMLKLCEEDDQHLSKLALLSLSAVFKDIIPGYRIRLPSDKELETKVSKDVQKTRFYEYTLLSSYKAYIQKLIPIGKDGKIQHVHIRCLCALLDAVPHFNFVETLLMEVVNNVGSQDDLIRNLCCSTIKSLFANEGKHGGKVTADAVRLIADLVKARNCQLHPDAIEVFMSLSFDGDLCKSEKPDQKANSKKIFHKNGKLVNPKNDRKKEKKEQISKMREEITSEYKAVSLAIDLSEKKALQSETLAAVFETYFRILKHASNNADPASSEGYPVLIPCLNGLAKFSNLLDLDYIGDLMKYLKTLACNASRRLSVSARLQCCIVAFKVMRNNLDALNVDLHEFYLQFYGLILEYKPERDDGAMLAEALRIILCEDRQHDMQKCAAFVKRLATFCLCVNTAEAMAALTTLKHLLVKNAKCRNLLENDAGGGSVCGSISKYRPEVIDPNQSGALASVLWELNLLSRHYNTSVSAMTTATSTATTNQVAPYSKYQLSFSSSQSELSNPKFNSNPPPLKRKSKTKIPFRKLTFQSPSFQDQTLDHLFFNHFRTLNNVNQNVLLRRRLDQTIQDLKFHQHYVNDSL